MLSTGGATLDSLSRAKGLPMSFLEELGWRDSRYKGTPAIAIPYPDASRAVAFPRHRIRLSGPDHYRQPAGVKLMPYGLDRLDCIPRGGEILLVEGETDTATCWLNGIAALGLPGAASWNGGWAQLVRHLEAYVWQEPGVGGATFVERAAQTVIGMRVIKAPPDAKDPNELWLAVGCDLAAFQDRIESLKLAATTLRPVCAPVGADGHRRHTGHLEAAVPEIQREFYSRMAQLGVHPKRRGDEMLLCPWHGDKHKPNLHVNWEAAVFNCFVCGAGGGIGKLRQFAAKAAPPRPKQPRSEPLSGKSAFDDERHIDPEIERSRLVHAVKQTIHSFDQKTGRALWEQILECHVAQIKYECITGHRIAYPFSCGFQLCPTCVPTRLRADFRRHADNLPNRVALFRVTPPPGNLTHRDEIGAWFRSWRRKSNIPAGFYGVRLRMEHPDVLLVLPADQVPAGIVSNPHATLVAADVALDEAVSWYVKMFLEEISSWKTPDELLTLLAAVKGRRRFQGFGKYYANKEPNGTVDADQLFTGEPQRLHRASGGSAKGSSKALACPFCGSGMRTVGIAPSAEGMQWDSKHGCYLWDTWPPAFPSAN